MLSLSINHSTSAPLFRLAPCPSATQSFFLHLSTSPFSLGGSDVSTEELSACRHSACPLWNIESSTDVPAYGTTCSTMSAAVRCSEGVPSDVLPRSQGPRSPAASTAWRRLGTAASPTKQVLSSPLQSILEPSYYFSLGRPLRFLLRFVPKHLVAFHILRCLPVSRHLLSTRLYLQE